MCGRVSVSDICEGLQGNFVYMHECVRARVFMLYLRCMLSYFVERHCTGHSGFH